MRHGNPVSQCLLGQSQAGNLRRYHHGRAAFQFARQIRQRHGLAELHQTDQVRERNGKAGYFLRNGADRGSWEIERFAPRPLVRRWPRADRSTLLHKLGGVALCSGGKTKGRRLRRICLAVSATAKANGWGTTAGEKVSSHSWFFADKQSPRRSFSAGVL